MVAHGIEFDLAEFLGRARAFGGDMQDVEVKAAVGQLPKSLAETLSAFSNTSGGVVVLGLSEKDGFAPAAGFDAHAMQDALGQMCTDKMEPPVRAGIDIVEHDGAPVVVATVPEMPPYLKPCYVKARSLYDGSYVRVGDGDRKLSRYEVDRVMEERRQPRHDERIVYEAAPGDLDKGLVEGYLARMRTLAPRVFGKLADEDALLCSRVLKRDEDGVVRPTLAGLMALGFYPQQFFPRLGVTFAVFPGASKSDLMQGSVRFLDSKSIVGPVPVMISETLASIRRNMKTVSYMNGPYRVDVPEYPEDAVREALANALMHRDYSPEGCGSAVQVNMFADRLEIMSPGGLYGPVTVESLGQYGVSATRNEYLSNILEATPFAEEDVEKGYVVENKGTGFAQIRRALALAGMPDPMVRDDISTFCLSFGRRDWEGCGGERSRTSGLGAKGGSKSAGTRADRRPNLTGRVGVVKDSGAMRMELDGDQEWIVEWLRIEGPSKAADIAQGLGASRATAVRKLNALCEQGIVKRDGRPRSPELTYSLTS